MPIIYVFHFPYPALFCFSGQLGGIEAYQKASINGEALKSYNTSKWVLKSLKEKGFRKAAVEGEPQTPTLKTLDVGAINNHFKGVKWMDLTPIDVRKASALLPSVFTVSLEVYQINPMDPGVIKCDFFDFAAPSKSFDIVVLSLVINYVGDARKRGLMLLRCAIWRVSLCAEKTDLALDVLSS